jgi:hypothetical protein
MQPLPLGQMRTLTRPLKVTVRAGIECSNVAHGRYGVGLLVRERPPQEQLFRSGKFVRVSIRSAFFDYYGSI